MTPNSTQAEALRLAVSLLDDLAEVGALGAPDAAAVRAGSAALSALVNAAEPDVADRGAARAVEAAAEAARLLHA